MYPAIDRKNGFFYLRITYEENGKKIDCALDLLEYEYCVDYVKTTMSMKFINAFIERYKERFKKEPTIGSLGLNLKDYIDFYKQNDQNCSLNATVFLHFLSQYKMQKKYKESSIQNAINEVEEGCCNKSFNFDKLLDKIITINNLGITKQEFSEVLKKKFKATTNIEKMFVLAEKSAELKKEIEKYKEKKSKYLQF